MAMKQRDSQQLTPRSNLTDTIYEFVVDLVSIRKFRRRLKALNQALRQINPRALIVLVGLIILAGVFYQPLARFQASRLRQSALDYIQSAVDAGQIDQALQNLDAFLQKWPDDVRGLELEAELMAEASVSPPQIIRAIDKLQTLLRLDPNPPARQADRLRLVKLLIRWSDLVRTVSEREVSKLEQFQSRYQAARLIAEERIKLGADDAEAHRLLATTLDRLVVAGASKLEAETIKEYQKALRRDPGDTAAAEGLATFRFERRKDQAGADQVLDNLIKARPRSVEARLVRARFLMKTGRIERAKVDAEAASRLEPTNRGVRIMAVMLAMKRGDLPGAHRHLNAIPKADRQDTRVIILTAHLESLGQNPDRAITTLRRGLVQTAGTDQELIWRLAYLLIGQGRVPEAQPLLAQYRRLCGQPNHPMVRFLEGVLEERSGHYQTALAGLELVRDELDLEWKGEIDLIIGRCHEALGDRDLARLAYERARERSLGSVQPYLALAHLFRSSDLDRAITVLEQSLPLVDDKSLLLAELVSAKAERQLAHPGSLIGWSAVETAIDLALKTKPDDAALIQARAQIHVVSGRDDEARSVLDQATQGAAKAQADVWLAHARALEKQQRFAEALKVLNQGSNPAAAGDKAVLRVARAHLLIRSGHGRDALNLLTEGKEKFSRQDQALLARARVDLWINLADRSAARLACVEWADLVPTDRGPGLKLLQMARQSGSDEELDQGIELLRSIGGEDDPEVLAARALSILAPTGPNASARETRLEEAETISERLGDLAPKLAVTALVRAILLEQNGGLEEAITEYKAASVGDTTGLALPRLVALLTRLDRTADLAALKAQQGGASIDRMVAAQMLTSDDKEHTEALLTQLIAADPTSLELRNDLIRVLRDQGKTKEAEASLQGLINRRPELSQPWLVLVALQAEHNDRAGVLATIERSKVGYKGPRPDLLKIRGLWLANERDAARRLAQDELTRQPDDLAILRLASEIEEIIAGPARAEPLLVRALRLDPKLNWARRRLALSLSNGSDRLRAAEAQALVESLGAGAADSPDDRLVKAIVLSRNPDATNRPEVIRQFQSLIDDLALTHPASKQARIHLAQIFLGAHDPAEAARVILPATTELAEPAPPTLALAIEALTQENKPEEARQLLDRLVKVQPELPQTLVCRALVLKAEGDRDAAASVLVEAATAAAKTNEGQQLGRYYFEQLVHLGCDDAAEELGRVRAARWPAELSPLAQFLAIRGRVDQAVAACRATYEAGQPQPALLTLWKLDNLERLDQPGKARAIELVLQAGTQYPRDAAVLEIGAAILRRQHRYADEAAFYGKILAAHPKHAGARNNLAWVLAHDLGRAQEALAEVDRITTQGVALPQLADTRGMILIKLGRVDEAIVELERISRANPSAVHQLHLAQAYAQAQRSADSQRAWEAAKLAANLKPLGPEDRAELEAFQP